MEGIERKGTTKAGGRYATRRDDLLDREVFHGDLQRGRVPRGEADRVTPAPRVRDPLYGLLVLPGSKPATSPVLVVPAGVDPRPIERAAGWSRRAARQERGVSWSGLGVSLVVGACVNLGLREAFPDNSAWWRLVATLAVVLLTQQGVGEFVFRRGRAAAVTLAACRTLPAIEPAFVVDREPRVAYARTDDTGLFRQAADIVEVRPDMVEVVQATLWEIAAPRPDQAGTARTGAGAWERSVAGAYARWIDVCEASAVEPGDAYLRRRFIRPSSRRPQESVRPRAPKWRGPVVAGVVLLAAAGGTAWAIHAAQPEPFFNTVVVDSLGSEGPAATDSFAFLSGDLDDVLCDENTLAWRITVAGVNVAHVRDTALDQRCKDRRAAGPDLNQYAQAGDRYSVPAPDEVRGDGYYRWVIKDRVARADVPVRDDQHMGVWVPVDGGRALVECTDVGAAVVSTSGPAVRGEYARAPQADELCSGSDELFTWRLELTDPPTNAASLDSRERLSRERPA
ncbi:hypothetical protein [Cellulomonas sp. ES6]|uniref:hypothetical protein n=1 Tax=Cellulomonas sp. ES6 TaxID=3039384 RepID=UPI0024B77F81|nr:hypothetical protein [Cellulomonas sp. ES6]WHP16578.1 hypothetical protein P9841_13265 [Cellulomonas sp. ES6]